MIDDGEEVEEIAKLKTFWGKREAKLKIIVILNGCSEGFCDSATCFIDSLLNDCFNPGCNPGLRGIKRIRTNVVQDEKKRGEKRAALFDELDEAAKDDDEEENDTATADTTGCILIAFEYCP